MSTSYKNMEFQEFIFYKHHDTINPSEGKIVPVHAKKEYGEMDIQLNSSFILVQSLFCSSHCTLRPKSTWYSLSRQLGGPQSQYGRSGEEEHLLLLLHIEPQLLNHPVSSLFLILTMLSVFIKLIQDICYFHHCCFINITMLQLWKTYIQNSFMHGKTWFLGSWNNSWQLNAMKSSLVISHISM